MSKFCRAKNACGIDWFFDLGRFGVNLADWVNKSAKIRSRMGA
jgi:hypothetical protein